MRTQEAPTPRTEDPTAPLASGDGASQTNGQPLGSVVVHDELPPTAPRRSMRKILAFVVLLIALAVGLVVGIPQFIYAMHHVSTDDAEVNSHVTYVSARIPDQTTQVLVDDNQFVKPGDVLLQLDPTPYELAVAQRQAALNQANVDVQQKIAALGVAQAELLQAKTQARASLAGLRASWFLVATVGDFVRYELAALQSSFANLHERQASLRLAQEEFDRVNHLGPQNISQEEIDERREALIVAREQVNTAEQSVNQTQALLGLPQNLDSPATRPDQVAQNFNGTQYALSSFAQSLTQLGINTPIALPTLQKLKDKFQSISPDVIVENVPAVLAVKAHVQAARAALGGDLYDPAHPERQPEIVAAQKALDEAKLQLSYTTVRAPIAGYISKRSVNPGTQVAAGQALVAIRPIADAWIDANFKETQLKDILIGQKVDIYVDAYPGKVFHGRVAGFSPGTGAMMSLLPPENATGNYVKVVQRLPVRIDLTDAPSADTPLFAGLSAEPEIDLQAPPTGPDAGKRLITSAQGAALTATGAAARGAASPTGFDLQSTVNAGS